MRSARITAVVGVDPGKKGAATRIRENGETDVLRFSKFSEDELGDRLTLWFLEDQCVAYFEAVGAMPSDARSRAFTFGDANGFVRGAVVVLKMPVVKVASQTWQFEFNLGGIPPKERKNAHKARAKELCPDLDVNLETCDSILIATYAHRKQFGELTHGKTSSTEKRTGTGILWTGNEDLP